MTTINQKEYLKKYLGIGKAPAEKRKKKRKVTGDRLKIIDDDADMLIAQEIQEDISTANEDAPQIVAVIDERPPSLRIDEQTKNNLWKPIGEVHTAKEKQNFKLGASFKLNKQIKSSNSNLQTSLKNYNKAKKSKNEYNTECVGLQIKKEVNLSPQLPRSNDVSPLRKKDTEDYSPPRRKNRDSDSSPLRWTNSNEDHSPPRKRSNGFSPPRLRRDSEDLLPKRQNREESQKKRKYDTDRGRVQIKKEIDQSPQRSRSDMVRDFSPTRKKDRSSDSSLLKRSNKKDNSSPRRRNDDNSPRGRNRDMSPKGKSREEKSSPRKKPDKIKTTLNGKKAGLQSAKDLVSETALLKQKEDHMFQNMSTEVSGRNAATVVRMRKVQDMEEEARQMKKEKETKEKYDLWGKGLKQVEEQSEKIAEQLKEMSKPLARYANDEDLEKYLKEQEREGDPMLDYIRKKKRKQAVTAGIPEKPMYMGEFMPNRFGIRPGYRWDGVDRSNGYEKKWFEVQNSKKATQEDAFKWSTEDM